ncbi:MAG: threonine-phosphate decarboxylase CobD [Methylocella sp.]
MRLWEERAFRIDRTGGDLLNPPQSHGGDLSLARKTFPAAPEPWLDLSTGVSPYAYPFHAPPPESWTRLPDAAALAALEATAAAAYRAASDARVVAAPGTQAIIGWLPHLFPARRVGVLGFTYFEHAQTWAASGAAVSIAGDLGELEDISGREELDVAVIVNPNNPDGRIVAPERLRALADFFQRRGKLLIVDQAFADFLDPATSSAPPQALVLRSFGKAYGLPGLRLGFALAPPDWAQKLRAALGAWPVSGAAIAIGVEALSDAAWLAATREKLSADAAALDAILADTGFTPLGGAPLFRLASALDAPGRFQALAEAGIWVRRFADRPDWLRFAIPKGESDRARLRAALGAPASEESSLVSPRSLSRL